MFLYYVLFLSFFLSKIARYRWNLPGNELKPNKFHSFVAQHRSLRKNGKKLQKCLNLPTFHCQLQDSGWEMLRTYISKSDAAVCIQSIADQTLWNRKNKPTKSVSVCGKHSARFGSWSHNRQQNNFGKLEPAFQASQQ